jgi:Ca2+:H+ antiporter
VPSIQLKGCRNAPELIISILALRHGEVVIVQTSLVGSVLSNVLLVLGMAFCAAGIHSSPFDKITGRVSLSIMSVCVGTLLILRICFPTSNGQFIESLAEI